MNFKSGIFCATVLLSACQPESKPAEASEIKAEQSNIIFKDSLGHTIRSSDLANVSGKVNYEVMGNFTVDPAANALHQEARVLGQAGKYDESISKLEKAIKIQPAWAYPTYDLAYTYLLKGDFVNALKYYKKTDELEPRGFFTAKTAMYSLEGEKNKIFPEGLYISYLQIEWTDDAAKKLEIAKAITEKVPDFAPAWKEVAYLLKDQTQRLNAIEQGLSKNPDADTKGMLLMNKAIILNEKGKKEEAKQLLGTMIFSPETTYGNVELARFTLKSISQN